MDNSKSLLTSRGNAKKLPALLEYLKNKEYKNILNFGCGMYGEAHKKELEKYSIKLINYDKYIHNIEVLNNLDFSKMDCIICSNVLNVIPDTKEIISILEFFKSKNKPVYISIYEGDKSNLVKINKNGCYQRNETKKIFYEKFLKNYGYTKENKFFKLDF